MGIIKQVVGIDVSKDTLAVSYGTLKINQEQLITKPITVDNNQKGFKELMLFVKKNKVTSETPVYFVMEATGVKLPFPKRETGFCVRQFICRQYLPADIIQG